MNELKPTIDTAVQEAVKFLGDDIRPKNMVDVEFLVWTFERICLEVSMGIGGVNRCQDYGRMRYLLRVLIENTRISDSPQDKANNPFPAPPQEGK